MNEHECMHFSLINTNSFNSTPCNANQRIISIHQFACLLPKPHGPPSDASKDEVLKYQPSLPKIKCLSAVECQANQSPSYRNGSIIQLNSTWHHWTVPECHSIAPSGFCHINIELTWVGTSKVVLAVTKPPCSTSSSCPLECKKCWRMFLTRKKAWKALNLWISKPMSWSSWINLIYLWLWFQFQIPGVHFVASSLQLESWKMMKFPLRKRSCVGKDIKISNNAPLALALALAWLLALYLSWKVDQLPHIAS